MGFTSLGALWLLMGALAVAPAAADVRTGRGVNADPEPARSSLTHPVLREADVRYDSDAGRIDATVSLFGSLAGVGTALSALAPWRVRVSFGIGCTTGSALVGWGRGRR